mgnify:CR=1 FL=1
MDIKGRKIILIVGSVILVVITFSYNVAGSVVTDLTPHFESVVLRIKILKLRFYFFVLKRF